MINLESHLKLNQGRSDRRRGKKRVNNSRRLCGRDVRQTGQGSRRGIFSRRELRRVNHCVVTGNHQIWFVHLREIILPAKIILLPWRSHLLYQGLAVGSGTRGGVTAKTASDGIMVAFAEKAPHMC